MLSKRKQLSVLPMVESKHLAMDTSIVIVNDDVAIERATPKGFSIVKYKN